MDEISTLTLNDAQTRLKQVSLNAEIEVDRAILRQSLLVITPYCDYQIFGVCADTADEALEALHQYTDALGYESAPPLEKIVGSVYLKYNPHTGLCYLDRYVGTERGVLVACQSAYDDGIRDTYGYLPLDLFAHD
ncbi:MAG: DUF1824 family protein [Cyanobacteria bacterium SID2]|nr:DUF1824 family protein [Cyanobacteria bacterium SID2]MBP0005960.1 DUF1824 family protein [Cyanobacteria bacterium SBC]